MAPLQRSFGAKCSKCCRSISATDWVRKARERVYHLACFACDACKRQLSTGEEFALHDGRLLCKAHYLETLDGGSTSSDEGGESESYQKNKAKRVRTTFTEEQLQVLQANFQLDSNPDGQDLERIAQITGLSKRVTQVWFQNSRARQKKHLHTGKLKGQIHHASAPIPRGDTDSSPFGRHINLHLTYSFQSPPSLSQQPNVVSAIPLGGATNNNNSKVTVVSASAPSPVPPTTNTLFPSHAHVSMDSSLDQTPQDSLLSCMQGEV
ncbi:LIM/homeobox protein Awh isoform X2 [Ischnura elegans]|uniref:LIM/homeobox protein Awh isoform X2 n=1 Tax=Ischnura elegans TaxID=197161 RepID=UPI001ED8A69F|nr:LIM/homeobox protein Awh isoform X2 [Ischnura elegans]